MRLVLQDLADRIGALDEASFQLLCERFLRLEHPDLFPRIVPRGRNAAGKTVKGWPDGYRINGATSILFEATRSSRWRTHLAQDFDHLRTHGSHGVKAYFFFAWAPEPDLTEAQELQRAAAAAGVAPGGLHLIFRAELVERLSQARHAALRHDALGLSTSSEPFVLIESAMVFGSDELSEFAPTRLEHELGHVDVPPLRRRVDAALAETKFAFVRGRGASGKTTLAVQIALDARADDRPAYYWDLSDDEDPRDAPATEALDVLATRAGPGVVFVVDNVHRRQRFARRLYDHWRSAASGSRLLFVGREVSPRASHGRTPPLRSLEDSQLVLSAGPEEVAGVLRRLARRAGAAALTLPEDAELERLAQSFGGDLVALSAAVASKIDQTSTMWPHVTPLDARQHVRERYLADLQADELRELVLICSLSWLELGAAESIVDVGLLERPLAQGAVEDVIGRHGRRYVRTTHPGLGDLIGRAAADDGTHAEGLADAVDRRPALAALVAPRLVEAGEERLATALLARVADEPAKLASYLIGRAGEFVEPHFMELADRHLSAAGHADSVLVQHADTLAAAMVDADGRRLVATLKWMARVLPHSHTATCSALSSEPHLTDLAYRLADEPFSTLASRLDALERHLPTISARTLHALLTRRHRATALARWLISGPLARRRHLAKRLRTTGADQLLDQILELEAEELLCDLPLAPLAQLEPTQRRAALPVVTVATSEAGRTVLEARALESPEELANVLAYAAREDPVLGARLAQRVDDVSHMDFTSVVPDLPQRLLRAASTVDERLARAGLREMLSDGAVQATLESLMASNGAALWFFARRAEAFGFGGTLADAVVANGLVPELARSLRGQTLITVATAILGPLGRPMAAELPPSLDLWSPRDARPEAAIRHVKATKLLAAALRAHHRDALAEEVEATPAPARPRAGACRRAARGTTGAAGARRPSTP